jgi:GNAT superfamily N-acetyltransferase
MHRIAPSTVSAITRCWADHFGCGPEHFQTNRTLAVPHLGLGDYHGVFVFRWDEAVVASVPAPLLATVGARIEQLSAAEVTSKACIRAVGAVLVERVIGPAVYCYTDTTSLRPRAATGLRVLTRADAPLLEELRIACSTAEWDEAGALTSDRPLAGQIVGGQLVAVAGYTVWWGRLAHLAVITAPAYRGQGYGKAVVRRSAEAAMRHGFVPQYRALEVNQASIGLATALGFEQCATSIALRLRPLPDP